MPCMTWGASLFQWEYLWSPRMGHVSPNAIWTLIWCFAPINMMDKQMMQLCLKRKQMYFFPCWKHPEEDETYRSKAEARQDHNHSCCPKLCTWWLQNVPADGLGLWLNRHRCHSFWKEDLEPSEIKIPKDYERTNWFEQSYNNSMVN